MPKAILLARRPMRRFLTGMAVACCVSSAAFAFADQKYEIKPTMQAGQNFTFNRSMQSKMTMEYSSNGQILQKLGSTMSQTREGTVTITEVKEGIPSAVRIVFGKECKTNIKMDGQPEQNPEWPMSSKTVNLSHGPDGGIKSDIPQDVDPAIRSEVEQLLETDTTVYPKDPVGVGDEWTPDAARFRQAFGLAAGDKIDLKCKLVNLGAAGGLKTYDVATTGTMSKTDHGMTVTMDLDGLVQIDALSGIQIAAKVSLKTSTQGQQQVNGPNGPMAVAVSGNGTVEVVQTGTRADDVKVDPPLAAVPMKPVAPGAPAENPLDPHPQPQPNNPLAIRKPVPASPFNGSFKGDALSADLKVEHDSVTGSISLSGKQYPVTAVVKETTVVGTFQVGAAVFHFTATLAGDEMTLDSDGNKYTMKKQAPANPLAQ